MGMLRKRLAGHAAGITLTLACVGVWFLADSAGVEPAPVRDSADAALETPAPATPHVQDATPEPATGTDAGDATLGAVVVVAGAWFWWRWREDH